MMPESVVLPTSQAKYTTIITSPSLESSFSGEDVEASTKVDLGDDECCIQTDMTDSSPLEISGVKQISSSAEECPTHHRVGIAPLAVLIFYSVSGVFSKLHII